jgi:hypothetical protein
MVLSTSFYRTAKKVLIRRKRIPTKEERNLIIESIVSRFLALRILLCIGLGFLGAITIMYFVIPLVAL